jgi:hypothetical protein
MYTYRVEGKRGTESRVIETDESDNFAERVVCNCDEYDDADIICELLSRIEQG